MAVYAAAASYREGILLGGHQGKAQGERALARVQECAGLAPGVRLLTAVTPGYRD